MRRSINSLALAFAAMAASAGASLAADAAGDRAERVQRRFEKADVDKSGDITFEEFAAAMNTRFEGADADKDGKMTVGEIASEIDRMRSRRMAERLVKRFDANADGVLTADEVQSRQKKMFALLDRNDDGKIVPAEMPKGRAKRR